VADRGSPLSGRTALVVAVPLLAASVLLLAPDLDVEWRDPDAHFWLVTLAALAGAVIAGLSGEAAARRGDGRLLLLSLAFGAAALFLGVHALATPGVVADAANTGFESAVPAGLFLAALLAAASTVDLGDAAVARILRLRPAAWSALVAAAGVTAWMALADGGALAGAPDAGQVDRVAAVLGVGGLAAFAWAAWRFLGLARRRGRARLLASMIVALVLLADALAVVTVGRNWRASWWEWHLLMVAAFIVVAATARREARREGGRPGLFDSLALERTLERVRADYAGALDDLVRGIERAADVDERADLRPLVEGVVRRFDLSDRQGHLLEEAALALGENRRLYRELDRLFRSYLSPDIAAALVAQPDRAALGGAAMEVSVLHADLAGFTTYSEAHDPSEVLEMLNAYFGAVVPAILTNGGTVTLFAGDAVMAVFGAPVPHADHAARACAAARDLQLAAEQARSGRDCPRFRVGVATGPAVVGNVGSDALRSFTAIGDTVNLAARLEGAAPVGGVLIDDATRVAAGPTWTTEPVGPLTVKGRAEPVTAHVLRA
jgi:class 3 adenylate cyclase